VHGKRGITADTEIRLARYFGTSEEFWMNLQSNYELRRERRALRDKISEITPLKIA
jgi:addiction module HigA family antidote